MDEEPGHEELVFLYHSGELPQAGRERFEKHLASCDQCRRSLEDLSWASDLAREAAVRPEAGLTRRALARTLGEDGVRIWADRARSMGMGLGLAFAVGLFLLRTAHPPEKSPAWPSGLDTEFSELDRRLDRLDADLSLDSWNVEFKENWEHLGRSRQGLKSQLDEQEEV
ncbi:MAG TPA: hypothetical protein DD417_01370 [Elusimicrobia bacterium]|nr:MAG: hypothetical protein A2X37_06825 [Elusimicrobia bacterium GWA2_66_18]OGR73495.1 MAG: hypothetical protein A2X40_06810 [Elusimicrobia bacterium GWC2_65_9]HBL15435.1 hypothetical protein [Elusimicrobiota bacterium]